jgi:hypothetical protein
VARQTLTAMSISAWLEDTAMSAASVWAVVAAAVAAADKQEECAQLTCNTEGCSGQGATEPAEGSAAGKKHTGRRENGGIVKVRHRAAGTGALQ